MSFKDDAKRELLTVLPEDTRSIMAFLSALARTQGSIELSYRRQNLAIRLDSYEVGVQIAELFKRIYPAEYELRLEKNVKTGKPLCTLLVPSGFTKQALEEFELMSVEDGNFSAFSEGVPQQLLDEEKCRKAYFQGLFLGVGSIYVPSEEKGGYHFELSLDGETLADDVKELLSDLRINTRMSDRAERKLVYVKDKHIILAALHTLSLNDCALRLEGIIRERETANSLNRSVICETANLDKTIEASAKLLLALAKLRSEGLYESLPPQLLQTAEMRASHPEASLAELAELLGVTKSCLNHRLHRLLELAGM